MGEAQRREKGEGREEGEKEHLERMFEEWSPGRFRGIIYVPSASGGTNKEFNLRHDWHSLFSNEAQLQMKHYSTKYFPHADEYVSLKGYGHTHIGILKLF